MGSQLDKFKVWLFVVVVVVEICSTLKTISCQWGTLYMILVTVVAISVPMHWSNRRLTDPEPQQKGSSSRLIRRSWLAATGGDDKTPDMIGRTDTVFFFSRDCFPCGLMAPPATDWDGAGTEQRYGGSCYSTEKKRDCTPNTSGFW